MTHIKTYQFKSMDNESEIYGVAYLPNGKNKGFLQILHDQYDHIDRYQEVMEYFANEGYCTFGHDMMGHGKSIRSNNQIGYLKSSQEHLHLVQDVNLMFALICEDFQENILAHYRQEKKPMLHILLGIGFGACLARVYMTQFQDVNALILYGDKGIVQPLKRDQFLCNFKLHQSKKDYKDNNVRRRMLKDYNHYIKESSCNAWRTSIKKQQRIIDYDPLCNFDYSIYAQKSFLSLESVLDVKGWCDYIPEYLPLFIISGYLDPVNRYTRNLDVLLEQLKQTSAKNIFYRYYEESRHDLFFDQNRKETMHDISYFLKKYNISR